MTIRDLLNPGRFLVARRSRIQAAKRQGWIDSGRLRLGRGTYGGFELRMYSGDPEGLALDIGRYCSIGDGVEFLPGGGDHPEWVSMFPFKERLGLPGDHDPGRVAFRGPITVGNDVWIGRGALILGGVTIGDGAVIAARAVVAQDVRPYAIVAGNPAREKRRRFDDATVEACRQCAGGTGQRPRSSVGLRSLKRRPGRSRVLSP